MMRDRSKVSSDLAENAAKETGERSRKKSASLVRAVFGAPSYEQGEQALDKLGHRHQSEPKIVHDHGSQFLSREWRLFVKTVGVTDIKTRVAHPQPNGLLERLHRTHREEGLIADDLREYYQALEAMTSWAHYYNNERPHSALHCLCPKDYYRGNPEARLAEREQKLSSALQARALY